MLLLATPSHAGLPPLEPGLTVSSPINCHTELLHPIHYAYALLIAALRQSNAHTLVMATKLPHCARCTQQLPRCHPHFKAPSTTNAASAATSLMLKTPSIAAATHRSLCAAEPPHGPHAAVHPRANATNATPACLVAPRARNNRRHNGQPCRPPCLRSHQLAALLSSLLKQSMLQCYANARASFLAPDTPHCRPVAAGLAMPLPLQGPNRPDPNAGPQDWPSPGVIWPSGSSRAPAAHTQIASTAPDEAPSPLHAEPNTAAPPKARPHADTPPLRLRVVRVSAARAGRCGRPPTRRCLAARTGTRSDKTRGTEKVGRGFALSPPSLQPQGPPAACSGDGKTGEG